jgi:protein transport protein SEC24
LIRELPPSISDLSLPPPPIILPPNSTIIPDSETANASPDYFRSTLNVIPTNNSLLKKSKLPLALVVRPYIALHDEDEPVPVSEDTIISRCRRCRAYINPFVTLTDGGRRWRCNLCNLLNDIPSGFSIDELTKTTKNFYDRPELNYAVTELIAPTEYLARSPPPCVFCFLIDVSTEAINSGLTSTVTRTILESLDRLPNRNSTTRVAFIGVDSNLHYFKFNEGKDDQMVDMLIVSDIDEPFLPSPDSLLVNLTENRKGIEKLLIDFPSYFEGTANGSFALGPALKAGHKMISSIGGKLIGFGSTLPNIGEGKLAIRDEEQSGKAKESQTLLNAADKFYKSFAVECNSAQVTVDLFLTSSKYQDVATLSNLPRYTAGQTHFYPAWSAATAEDVTKFSKEVSEHLSMEIALEAVLRVRASSGVRGSAFYGNFFNRSSDLCSFPTFPRDQSYLIEVSIEETITKPVVFFQAAVLHSTCFGERRIRVMNLAIPTSSKLDDIFASADQLAIVNYFTHKAVEKAFSHSLPDARELLIKSLADLVSVYKKELVAGNVSGSSPLQFSTNLRMLPLLLFSLTKHVGLRGEKVPADHRAIALNNLATLPIHHLIKYIYPTVYSLHDMTDWCGLPEQITQVNEETGEDETVTSPNILMPEPINDSLTNWENYGLYLIDTSTELFLWVGGDAVSGLVHDVFGTENLYTIPYGKTQLPEFSFEESEFNYRVRQIIGKLREQNDQITWKNLYVVIGGSSHEPMELTNQRDLLALRMWATSSLVEDKTGGSQAYREFLNTLKSRVAQ